MSEHDIFSAKAEVANNARAAIESISFSFISLLS
jgi:hypothetical protein